MPTKNEGLHEQQDVVHTVQYIRGGEGMHDALEISKTGQS